LGQRSAHFPHPRQSFLSILELSPDKWLALSGQKTTHSPQREHLLRSKNISGFAD
jgi:hypothetical protein